MLAGLQVKITWAKINQTCPSKIFLLKQSEVISLLPHSDNMIEKQNIQGYMAFPI